MKIEESIYPYYPEAERLPFFLAGIGGSEYQGHIQRPDGYQWHQILFCIKGRGILKYGNEKMILAENDCVFLPKKSEHEYYPEGDAWEVRWIAFDGFACGETLKQLGMNGPVVVSGNDGGLERIFDRMVISQRTDIPVRDLCTIVCSNFTEVWKRIWPVQEAKSSACCCLH